MPHSINSTNKVDFSTERTQ